MKLFNNAGQHKKPTMLPNEEKKMNTASSKDLKVTKKHKVNSTYLLVAAKHYINAAKDYLEKTKNYVVRDHEKVDKNISLIQKISSAFKTPKKDITHPSEYE